MKASELIERLKKLKDEHGDLDVELSTEREKRENIKFCGVRYIRENEPDWSEESENPLLDKPIIMIDLMS